MIVSPAKPERRDEPYWVVVGQKSGFAGISEDIVEEADSPAEARRKKATLEEKGTHECYLIRTVFPKGR